jgi:hypothetical protein
LGGADLGLLVEHAGLHDREQLGGIAQDRQVRERVAVHQQEVGEVAVFAMMRTLLKSTLVVVIGRSPYMRCV